MHRIFFGLHTMLENKRDPVQVAAGCYATIKKEKYACQEVSSP